MARYWKSRRRYGPFLETVTLVIPAKLALEFQWGNLGGSLADYIVVANQLIAQGILEDYGKPRDYLLPANNSKEGIIG